MTGNQYHKIVIRQLLPTQKHLLLAELSAPLGQEMKNHALILQTQLCFVLFVLILEQNVSSLLIDPKIRLFCIESIYILSFEENDYWVTNLLPTNKVRLY